MNQLSRRCGGGDCPTAAAIPGCENNFDSRVDYYFSAIATASCMVEGVDFSDDVAVDCQGSPYNPNSN